MSVISDKYNSALGAHFGRDRYHAGGWRQHDEERHRDYPDARGSPPTPAREGGQSENQRRLGQDVAESERARLAVREHQRVRPKRSAKVVGDDFRLVEQVGPGADAE